MDGVIVSGEQDLFLFGLGGRVGWVSGWMVA